ncbi:hypothetical protein N2152v2_006287 [Parachlorella kessleri]
MVGGGFASVAALAAACFPLRKKKEEPQQVESGTAGGSRRSSLEVVKEAATRASLDSVPPSKLNSDSLEQLALQQSSESTPKSPKAARSSHKHARPKPISATTSQRLELEGLEARIPEPLGTLGQLRVRHPPVEGLRVTGLLGQGTIGRAYSASWSGVGMIAVKVVENVVHHALDTQLDKAPVLSTTLDHPNVVAIYKVATVRLPSPSGTPRAGSQRFDDGDFDAFSEASAFDEDSDDPAWLTLPAGLSLKKRAQGLPVHFLDEQRASDTPPELMACRDLVKHPSSQLASRQSGPLATAASTSSRLADGSAGPSGGQESAAAGAVLQPQALRQASSEAGQVAARVASGGKLGGLTDRGTSSGGYARSSSAATAAAAAAAHRVSAAARLMRGGEQPLSPRQPETPSPSDWAFSPFLLGSALTNSSNLDVQSSFDNPGNAASGPLSEAVLSHGSHVGSRLGSRSGGWANLEREGSAARSATGVHAYKPGLYEVWLLQEYCNLGSLADCLKKRKLVRRADGSHRTSSIYGLLIDVAQGMECLHSRGVIHGELRANNVLLSASPDDSRGYQAKVADFGLSTLLDASQTRIHSRTMGTVGYLAVEVIKEGVLTKAADVFAFGMLMYEIWTCERIHARKTAGQVFKAVVEEGLRPPVPPDCPLRYAALMQACWEEEPGNRPPFAMIVRNLKDQLKEIQRYEDKASSSISSKPRSNSSSLERLRNLGAAASASASAALDF